MKHIEERDKYFNNYLANLNNNLKKSREEINHQEDYYKLISYNDANKLIGFEDSVDNRTYFTQREIESIESILKSTYKIELYKNNRYHTIVALRPKIGKELFRYEIWKLEDEWYIVKMGDIYASIYYQCDQFEGLLKLLNKTKL